MLASFTPGVPLKRLAYLLALLVLPLLGWAQRSKFTAGARAQEIGPRKVYECVERQPSWPGGGGLDSVAAEVRRRIVFPSIVSATESAAQTACVATFTINEAGLVRNARILNSSGGSYDRAVLAAVLQLPRFEPGRQNDRPVAARLTVPIALAGRSLHSVLAEDSSPGSLGYGAARLLPAPLDVTPPSSTDRICTYYVQQMPELPGMKGSAGISIKIQELMKTTVVPKSRGRVYVSFTVGANGEVYAPKILRGLNPTADAAVLRAVARLPRFVPGKQNGKPVSVSLTVPVLVK